MYPRERGGGGEQDGNCLTLRGLFAEVVIDDSDAASLPSGVPVEVTLDLASP